MHKIFYILILFIGMTSCYEQIEGCMDLESSNFGFDADTECDECCRYPGITISFVYDYQDTTYMQDSLYLDAGDNRFQVLDFSFYISDVSLESDGVLITSVDTVWVPISNENFEIITNDVLRLTDGSRIGRISNFKKSGTFDKLHFRVGLEEVIHDIDTSRVGTTIPLSQLKDDYNDGGVDWMKWRVSLGADEVRDTISYKINSQFAPRSIIKDILVEKFPGDELSITVNVNVGTWLAGIDFLNMEDREIQELLWSNVDHVFTIE